jgi:D-lactate dehydrogenase
LRNDLVALLGPDRVLSRPIDLIRFATDASPYRLFPKVVVIARTVDDVRKLLEYARQRHESITFRAAGTSLSGQAQGDGILVDVRRHWAGVSVEVGGRRLRARPGTILSRANLALLGHGYRLGPDPASASACTIGGVIANNSSGMCCGTTQNSYKTLLSLTFMLPSGTFIDSARADAEQQFAAAEPALAAGLMEIKHEIELDPELAARLRKKFSVKNTTGYHMEAFLDGATPLEIFRRLIVGSEGTLAFIAEAVFETIPDDQYRLTSFMIFPDMYAACAAVKPFVDHGAAAVELVDRASLRAVEGKPGVPDRWKTLPEKATALLIEFRAPTETARAEASGLPIRPWQGCACSSPQSLHATPPLRRSSGTCAAVCLHRLAAPGLQVLRLFWRMCVFRRNGSLTVRSICRRYSPSTATLESSSDTPRPATCTSSSHLSSTIRRRSLITAHSWMMSSNWWSVSTTVRLRPSMAPGATLHLTWNGNGGQNLLRSCGS